MLVLLAAMIGGCGGCIVGTNSSFHPPPPASAVEAYPMPHHTPKIPSGVSLRFAMVHDVIHERYPRHGQAYYAKRNEIVRKQLEEEKDKRAPGAAPGAERFALLDDLGVGLSFLGQHKEAVELMRAKLKEQEALGLEEKDLYSTYANLGTFLVLWQLAEGFGDVTKAKERLTESVERIRKAIQINPSSHFGREIWQAVIEEYLLLLLDKPELVLQFDMVGNKLDRAIDPAQNRSIQNSREWNPSQRFKKVAEEQAGVEIQLGEERRKKFITLVGAEPGWASWAPAETCSHRDPVPFDEPVLGIIGMWRLGGGPNPHFALALGEIMMRVGQRHIAWCAYERAADMAGGLGTGPIPDKFVEHCRRRQKVIEDQLWYWEVKDLRSRYADELAHGKRYQEAYREYEAQQVAAGVPLGSPKFYDNFDAEHGEIASPVGDADSFLIWKGRSGGTDKFLLSWPAILIFAGVSAFAVASVSLLLDRRSRRALPGSEIVECE